MTFQFPYAEPSHWVSPDSVSMSPTTQDWLLEEGSLTRRLQQHCNRFSVKVIGQHPAPVFDDEFHLFQRHHKTTPFKAVVREVLLYCDNSPWVFARSIFPLSALAAKNLSLETLGDASLGQSLFEQPDLMRSRFELTQVAENHSVAKLNRQIHQQSSKLWGRRSLFLTAGQQVLVSEFFLTPVPIYQERP